MIRVEVDPNRFLPGRPTSWTSVLTTDADHPLTVCDEVVAVQPEDGDEPDFISTARVMEVDERYGLAFLDVDWNGFHDEPV